MANSTGDQTHQQPPVFDAGPFEPTEAFAWGFAVLRTEPQRIGLPLIVAAFAMVVSATAVPSMLNGLVSAVTSGAPDSVLANSLTALARLFGAGVALCVCAYVSTGVYPFVLNVARGRPVEFTDLFRHQRFATRAVLMLGTISIATAIGSALCLLPGVLCVVATSMAMPLLLDADMTVVGALRGSYELTRPHLMSVFVLCVFGLVAILAGMLLCFAGAVFVTIPVTLLAQAYAFLRLQGEHPVPA